MKRTDAEQSFRELANVAGEVSRYDAILKQKIGNLNRLCGQAADAIAQHMRFVQELRGEVNKMAAAVGREKTVTLHKLQSLGKLDRDAFLKPEVANALRRALASGRRTVEAMKRQAARAEEFERELDKVIALAKRGKPNQSQ